MTQEQEQLIKDWQEGERIQKARWQEILRQGLYFASLGIDVTKRDSAWRNPPTVTPEGRQWSNGIHGLPRHYRQRQQRPKISQVDLADFD